jgi:mRNA interferase MazF
MVCPVSSKFPSDAPFIPLSPRDFLEGGLDICDESYVLTAMSFQIQPGEIIGKKGRVDAGVLESVYELHNSGS